MAHYAFLDANNIVTQVIVGRNEDEVVDGITDWEAHYAEVTGQVCKRTSYNTYRHYEPILDENQLVADEDGNMLPKVVGWNFIESRHLTGGTPFRGQYACIGDRYDAELDEFVSPVVETATEVVEPAE